MTCSQQWIKSNWSFREWRSVDIFQPRPEVGHIISTTIGESSANKKTV